MNTLINYTYRDASNCKSYNHAVIAGELSETDKQVILSCLGDGEYFIPHLVGLGEKTFDDYDPNGQEDRPWFELGYYSFEPTPAEPTVSITAGELVECFKECKDKWEELMAKEAVPNTSNKNLCPAKTGCVPTEKNTGKSRTVIVSPAWTMPELRMTIEVPSDRDDEEFIDEYLDGLLAEDLRYNREWEFID